VTRLPAHIDYGTITLDFELEAGGLELESNSEPGKWYFSQPQPGSCLVNIAKMIEILTNGQVKAAMHRVTAPKVEYLNEKTAYSVDGVPITTPRYSIPFFVAPDFDTPIEPAASLLEADGGVRKYPTTTVQEYADGFTKYQYNPEIKR
jgi:isopenicillin N synthase-like dioxygenase